MTKYQIRFVYISILIHKIFTAETFPYLIYPVSLSVEK